ncbi:TonB-dependent receptor [Porphyromonas gingivalis]|uniref:TonB-dependent receptor plug domain protein n=1 Tax=Porphyromonas gingivalis F0570 TaxID=1227271 RepID=A0A0E2LQT2_PORGN|nr:TonB-dependent receptor [Porphyromonas gingivalis]ERJ66632.1 TonB-dependent receptor plug domain protein [Porphyromonas gingivalis F0570]
MSINSIVHLYKRVLIVSILLLWAYPMFAQQHSIEIKVIDAENGNSIEFATVQWKGLNEPSYKNGTTTNKKGVAKLNTPAHQKLVLRVSYVGYQTITDTITANEKRHTLKLRPESTELANVVVFGKTKAQVIRESPEAVSVINAKELQGRSVSLETILNKTIGLKVGQTGGLGSSSRIIVHGLEGNRIQILWDGIPMNTSDGAFSLDEIPIDIIERIEVYKSIIPARFGCDGLGGAVNIVTKEFSMDYLDASYELGSYQTHKGSVFSRKNFPKSGILLGAGGYYTSAKNDYSFRVPERENLLVKRDHDRFRSYMLKGKVAFTKLWFDEISTEFGYYNRFNEIQGVLKNIQHAENKSGMFMLESKLIKSGMLNNRLNFESHFSLSHTTNNFVDTARVNHDFEGNIYPSPNGQGETGDVPHNSNDKGLEINERINLDYKLSTNHSLNLNTLINYARRQPSDDIASQHAGFIIGGFPSKKTSIVSGLTWEAKLFGRKLTNMFSAKYFHLHSEIEDLTSYEMIEAPKKKSNTTSQIGWIEAMKYEPFRGFHLKVSYQRAIRLPNSQELFGDGIITFPAAGLKPEKSHNFNLGFLIDKNDVLGLSRLQFEVNGFYMQVSDMIKLMKQHMAAGYVNAEKVHIKGIETELKLDISPTVYAYGNLTCQDVRDVLDYLPGTQAPNPTKGLRLPNIPYLFANFGAEYHSDRLFKNWYVKAFWDGKFTEEFFYFWELTKLQKRRIPRSFVNDIGLLLTYKNKYSIALECHNLMNKEVWDQFRQPLAGRTFHLKFRYVFSKGIL